MRRHRQAVQEETLLRPPPPLEVLDLPGLLGKQFSAPGWVVPDLLPVGFTLLAAPPKTGKSRLVLSLILRKAGFLPDGQRGGGLYLSLDDPSERRLQTRIRDLLDGRPLEGGVWFATSAATLDKGLCVQIHEWLRDHLGVRIVAIDALGTIKAKRSSDDVFVSDYQGLKGLQALALNNDIAVILVHHTRKAPDSDDPFNRISGTQGLAAVADALWLLDRPRGSTKERLLVSSRDGPDMILTLPTEDPLEGQWIVPSEDQAKAVFLKDQVFAALKEAGQGGASVRQLSELLDISSAQTRKIATRLLQEGVVFRLAYGQYAACLVTLDAGGASPGESRAGMNTASVAACLVTLDAGGASPGVERAEGTFSDNFANSVVHNVQESAPSPGAERAEDPSTKSHKAGDEAPQNGAGPGVERAEDHTTKSHKADGVVNGQYTARLGDVGGSAASPDAERPRSAEGSNAACLGDVLDSASSLDGDRADAQLLQNVCDTVSVKSAPAPDGDRADAQQYNITQPSGEACPDDCTSPGMERASAQALTNITQPSGEVNDHPVDAVQALLDGAREQRERAESPHAED